MVLAGWMVYLNGSMLHPAFRLASAVKRAEAEQSVAADYFQKSFAIFAIPVWVGVLAVHYSDGSGRLITQQRKIMQEVKDGDTIALHYKGTLSDGTVFDNSEGREPLEITVGEKRVIPGFEKAVLGMKVGETKTTTIPAGEAYGEKQDELLIKFPRDQMPPDAEPEVGQHLQMTTPQGQPVPVRIAAVAETEVTLDANHPLAGQDLTFELTLVKIA